MLYEVITINVVPSVKKTFSSGLPKMFKQSLFNFHEFWELNKTAEISLDSEIKGIEKKMP